MRAGDRHLKFHETRDNLAFNRLKQWRGIATRYDKKAVNYRAGIVLASMIIWLTT